MEKNDSKKVDLTHSMTHYLLTIHKLSEEGKRVKSVDIASHMDMARSSVTVALKKLKEKDLVTEDQNSNLILTPLAHKEVHEILSNRTLIYYFFKEFLGVSGPNSEKDSCLLEHLISQEAQEKLFNFMKTFLSCNPEKFTNVDNLREKLCLCTYKSLNEFKEKQQGDTHLVSLNKCSK
jgi:DtxR family Mn-dependent transcriptional regulator